MKLEQKVIATELALYMLETKETFQQAWEQKMLCTKKISIQQLLWSVQKNKIRKETKRVFDAMIGE